MRQQLLGPWRLEAELGSGGMGVVYRAVHVETGRLAAVKTVRDVHRRHRDTLRREVHALTRLRHPGVVQVLDHGTDGDLPWLAMAFVRGRPLGSGWSGSQSSSAAPTISLDELDGPDLPASPPTAPARDRQAVLTVCYRLARSLAYLHGMGCVHRDLKPANVLVGDDGWPVLVDFGLSVEGAGATRERLEAPEKPVGTPRSSAPEQIRGEIADARTDLYALGCLLYELLVGRPPFTGTSREVLAAHLFRAPTAPSDHADDVPPELDELVLGLLAKEPSRRIGRATDVADRLAALGADPARWPGEPTPLPYLYRPGLVGRASEQQRLQAALEAPEGAFFLVTGAPGVGKTRLARHVSRLARARDAVVLAGRCRAEGMAPLEGFREPLVTLVRRGFQAQLAPRAAVLAACVPELVPLAPEAPPEVPGLLRRQRVVWYVAEVLAEVAAERRVVLLLDDLQWADPWTLEAARELARRRPAGLVLLATSREALELEGAEAMPLEALDAASVRSMAADMLGSEALPDDLVDRTLAASEGNPFFVAEFLRTWRMADSGIPEAGSLADLVALRLRGLSGDARTVASALAILDRDAPQGWLGAIAQLDEPWLLDAVTDLLRHQVVEEGTDGRLRFAHDALREVARERVPEALAVVLHRRAAATVPPEEPDADWLRAWHLEQAGERARAFELLRSAGARLAPEAGARLLEAALRLAPEPQVPALVVDLCGLLSVIGRSAEVPDLLEPVLQRLEEPDLRSRARMGMVRGLRTRGRPRDAADWFTRALEDLDALEPRRQIELLQEGLLNGLALGGLEEAASWAGRALAVARRIGDRRAVGRLLGNLAVVESQQGRLARARELLEEALPALEAAGDLRALGVFRGNLGTQASLAGELERAAELYARAVEALLEAGDLFNAAVHQGNLGVVAWEAEDLEGAEGLLATAIGRLQAQGEVANRALYGVVLGMVRLDRGDLDGARATMGASSDLLDPVQDAPGYAQLCLGLARLERTAGHPEQAARWLRRAEETGPLPPPIRVWFHCEAGEAEAALALAGEMGVDPEGRSYLARFLREVRRRARGSDGRSRSR